MEVDEARQLLSGADHENPAVLTRDVLSKLTVEDVPEGASFLVGTRWEGGANPLDWGGKLRREGMVVFAEVTYSFTRRYWFAPLGVKQYLDLTRRAIETRHRVKGDIELIDYDDGDDDDDAIMALRFGIKATEKNLARIRNGPEGRSGNSGSC
jgi:hypothetical protein